MVQLFPSTPRIAYSENEHGVNLFQFRTFREAKSFLKKLFTALLRYPSSFLNPGNEMPSSQPERVAKSTVSPTGSLQLLRNDSRYTIITTRNALLQILSAIPSTFFYLGPIGIFIRKNCQSDLSLLLVVTIIKIIVCQARLILKFKNNNVQLDK